MKIPLHSYDAFFFDCDGVLLDANPIKSNAYYRVALPFGVEVAEQFREHHQATAGVSRYVKFHALLTEFLKREPLPGEVEELAERFGTICREELQTCQVCPGAREFLSALPRGVPAFVASGGKQDEVAEALEIHGLAHHFDGIFGSPRDKHQIISETLARFGLGRHCLFFGDSRYDFEVAKAFGFDFVFLWGKTDFAGWRDFFAGKSLYVAENFLSVLAGDVS